MDVKTREPITAEGMETMMESKQGRLHQNTWKPVAAGILAIVGGYVNIMMALFTGVGLNTGGFALIGLTLGTPFAVLAIVLGGISIIGGGFAIARRTYPLALIGSIAAMFPSLAIIPGVLSLIFVSLSSHEFERR